MGHLHLNRIYITCKGLPIEFRCNRLIQSETLCTIAYNRYNTFLCIRLCVSIFNLQFTEFLSSNANSLFNISMRYNSSNYIYFPSHLFFSCTSLKKQIKNNLSQRISEDFFLHFQVLFVLLKV